MTPIEIQTGGGGGIISMIDEVRSSIGDFFVQKKFILRNGVI